jgi:hypothetical protein
MVLEGTRTKTILHVKEYMYGNTNSLLWLDIFMRGVSKQKCSS